ncbi:MAG: acyl-CoA thioesterase [Methyloligellaceae bacterium]
MDAQPKETDLTKRESYPHWTAVTIRYSDQDSMGHVNNVSIAAYFEVARVQMVQTVLNRFDHPELDFILARVAIDYHNEFHYPGTVDVGARLMRLGNKSMTSVYGLFLGDRCLATSEAVNVFFDIEKRQSVVPPDNVRAALQAEITG